MDNLGLVMLKYREPPKDVLFCIYEECLGTLERVDYNIKFGIRNARLKFSAYKTVG